jgi:Right handed beta helix region
MKKVLYTLGILIPTLALLGALSFGFMRSNGVKAAPATSCTATGFFRDSTNLTAALIETTSGFSVTGSVNASGCNIGVYIGPGLTGTVTSAQVFGANYYGVVNNGSTVTVTKSQIHDIGENPLNGVQHGYGIYFTEDVGAKGTISSNLIWNYQKNGIVVRGIHSKVTITKNTVIGQGVVTYIAQNGIEVGEGAKGSVTNNIVTGNAYSGTGDAAGAGVLVYGGSCYGVALTIGITIKGNTLIGNDIGVSLSNLDGTSCIPTLTPTNITANTNIITNDAVNNTTGAAPNPGGYQAGISDQGDLDKMNNNSICGLGYTAVTPPPYLYLIDITNTNSPTATGNTSCLDGSPITPSLTAAALHIKRHDRASI